MTCISKLLLTLTVLFSANFAHAEFTEGKNAILVNLGFTGGGMAIGIDYENAIDKTFGIGGYLRMFPEDDDAPDRDPGMTAIGAFIRPHFNRQAWDFYLSPGFGFMSYEPGNNDDDETLIGPSFATGLLYEFSPNFSFGCELMNFYSWFGEDDYQGLLGAVSNEFMAKFRFVF